MPNLPLDIHAGFILKSEGFQLNHLQCFKAKEQMCLISLFLTRLGTPKKTMKVISVKFLNRSLSPYIANSDAIQQFLPNFPHFWGKRWQYLRTGNELWLHILDLRTSIQVSSVSQMHFLNWHCSKCQIVLVLQNHLSWEYLIRNTWYSFQTRVRHTSYVYAPLDQVHFINSKIIY